MKILTYSNAIVLAIAGVLLPQLDALLDAYRWIRANMGCVYDHSKRYAAGTIPVAEDTFDNFPAIPGRQPTKWADFIEKHKAELSY